MRNLRALAVCGAGSLLAVGALVASAGPTSAQPFGWSNLNPIQKRLLSGTLSFELDTSRAGIAARNAQPVSPTALATPQRPSPHGCPNLLGGNIKVNQNCQNQSDEDLAGRAQA